MKMERVIELKKEDVININGGGAFDIGYKIGKAIADIGDYYQGLWRGIMDGIDNKE